LAEGFELLDQHRCHLTRARRTSSPSAAANWSILFALGVHGKSYRHTTFFRKRSFAFSMGVQADSIEPTDGVILVDPIRLLSFMLGFLYLEGTSQTQQNPLKDEK